MNVKIKRLSDKEVIPKLEEVEKLDETNRGDDGHGSSGL